MESGRRKQKAYMSWHGRSVDVRGELNLPPGVMPWTQPRPGERGPGKPKLRGVPASPRMVDCLNICFHAACQKNPHLSRGEVASMLWTNVGTTCDRLPYSMDGPGSWTHSCTWYGFKGDVVLSGSAKLKLLGWDAAHVDTLGFDDFSKADLHSLAADAFSVPIASTFAYACFLNPWSPYWSHTLEPLECCH